MKGAMGCRHIRGLVQVSSKRNTLVEALHRTCRRVALQVAAALRENCAFSGVSQACVLLNSKSIELAVDLVRL